MASRYASRTLPTVHGFLLIALTLVATEPARAFDHAPFDQVLQHYVDDAGHVAYQRLATHGRTSLDTYLGALANADPTSWSTDEQKAFWINAYNATVLDAVLLGYAAESFFGRASLFKRFARRIAGDERTLDDIEHRIIRPRFRDPRTHFALVCASSSCPRLRRHAYTAATLDAALDAEARRFVNDGRRNVIDPATRTVRLSSIFDWFTEDFVAAAGSVPAYVARYVEGDAKRALIAGTPPGALDHLPYDWTLNAQAGERP